MSVATKLFLHFFFNFAVLNILTGVFVEKAVAAAQAAGTTLAGAAAGPASPEGEEKQPLLGDDNKRR